jgi:hypothetical protein
VRPAEWDNTLEAGKKEREIVIAIPPSNELRKEMETILRQKLGVEAELVSAPGPRNASRIASDRKAGVRYFDALIVGAGTAITLAHDVMLEPIEPLMMLPDVKDLKAWWSGHIWEDNLSTNRFLYSFVAAISTGSIWHPRASPRRRNCARSMTISRRSGKAGSVLATREFPARANQFGLSCGRSRAKTTEENGPAGSFLDA